MQVPLRLIIVSSLALFLLILNSSCTKQAIELVYPKPVDSSLIGKIRSVVVLGNSIVRMPADPSLGWNGNWGMAASSMDSDFVHILIRNLQSKDNRITVRFRNISDFEKDFMSFDLHSVDSLRNADLVVMKISENVQPYGPNYDQFILHYAQLIHYLDPSDKAVKLIVDGFWTKDLVNNDIRSYALSKHYPLISITDLSGSSANKGLLGHPTDMGMRQISERLWSYLRNYF